MPETICPDCLGEGEREFMSDRSPSAYYYVGTCETCGGSGVDPLYIPPITGAVLEPSEVGE